MAKTLTIRLSDRDADLVEWAKEATWQNTASKAMLEGLRRYREQYEAGREAELCEALAARRDGLRSFARRVIRLAGVMSEQARLWEADDNGGNVTLQPQPNCEKNRAVLYGEQGGFCNGCAVHFKPEDLTVDHVIPTARGGPDHLENLQLLCRSCNSLKGDRGQDWLLAKLNESGEGANPPPL